MDKPPVAYMKINEDQNLIDLDALGLEAPDMRLMIRHARLPASIISLMAVSLRAPVRVMAPD
jgi:hypothetical protein